MIMIPTSQFEITIDSSENSILENHLEIKELPHSSNQQLIDKVEMFKETPTIKIQDEEFEILNVIMENK